MTDTSDKVRQQERIEKSDAEWKATLTPEQYRVMREKGTERAFTGEYWETKARGTYKCAACGEPLFSSDTKFDSGTGWPSFYDPISPDAVATESDYSHFMRRTEALCSQLPRAPGARLPRRAEADRAALLHEFHLARV